MKLGLKKVPCVVADELTESQIKRYRILDNKLNESEWDIDNLKVELEDLNDDELNGMFEDL
jgi:site-specific DNA-methyltransferase (adenine-specific)